MKTVNTGMVTEKERGLAAYLRGIDDAHDDPNRGRLLNGLLKWLAGFCYRAYVANIERSEIIYLRGTFGRKLRVHEFGHTRLGGAHGHAKPLSLDVMVPAPWMFLRRRDARGIGANYARLERQGRVLRRREEES